MVLVSEQSPARQQEQNARRLFAQLDDRANAAQFSTLGVQLEKKRQIRGVLIGMPASMLL